MFSLSKMYMIITDEYRLWCCFNSYVHPIFEEGGAVNDTKLQSLPVTPIYRSRFRCKSRKGKGYSIGSVKGLYFQMCNLHYSFKLQIFLLLWLSSHPLFTELPYIIVCHWLTPFILVFPHNWFQWNSYKKSFSILLLTPYVNFSLDCCISYRDHFQFICMVHSYCIKYYTHTRIL